VRPEPERLSHLSGLALKTAATSSRGCAQGSIGAAQ